MMISWFEKFLLRFRPFVLFNRHARQLGVPDGKVERLHELFTDITRVDLFALNGGHCGFIIVLDQKIALFFYQDHDRFAYDGFELGQYNKGSITVLDGAQSDVSPYP